MPAIRIKPVVLVAVIILVLLGLGLAAIVRAEVTTLRLARADFMAGDYESGDRRLSSFLLPIFSKQLTSLRLVERQEQEKDRNSFDSVSNAERLLGAALRDRDTGGNVDATIYQAVTDALEVYLGRPHTSMLSNNELNRSFLIALPPEAIIAVDDFRSPRNWLRSVRFSVGPARQEDSIPVSAVPQHPETVDTEKCFGTDFPCSTFDSLYNRLLIELAPNNPYGNKSVYVFSKPDYVGTFQGARLLDWRNGMALVMAGTASASFGGNSSATWMSVIRFDRQGPMKIDGDLFPEIGGITDISQSAVSGLEGADWGAETTMFFECHACDHITRDFKSVWDFDQGKYILSQNRISPTAYAALVAFMRADEQSVDRFLEP